jgi:hypothetical protein
MDELLSIFKKYNRPASQKLLQLAKSEGLQVKSKKIKESLSSRSEEEQLKESKNRKESYGLLVKSI